ncbi:hypothetical protein AAY473_032790 [Plecturocebus cupreus]
MQLFFVGRAQHALPTVAVEIGFEEAQPLRGRGDSSAKRGEGANYRSRQQAPLGALGIWNAVWEGKGTLAELSWASTGGTPDGLKSKTDKAWGFQTPGTSLNIPHTCYPINKIDPKVAFPRRAQPKHWKKCFCVPSEFVILLGKGNKLKLLIRRVSPFGQTSLKLLTSGDPSTLAFQSAGIAGMSHHTGA